MFCLKSCACAGLSNHRPALSSSAPCKFASKNEVYVQNGLVLCGNAPDYVAPNYLHGERHPVVYQPNGKGMAFALFVRPVTDGQVIEKGNRIVIKGASYLTLISSTATGF